ncbi:2Fe-2S iron-sulfur cluster binding domain-containing protein [Paraburkholderia sp. Tr-20389]|uniref:2Fe-2S iron-sulfur cluster binding domain-containing protein n=1 Tax=Paraburkholderia sp. Tr-20389 TaxID=2703903 RepID=UPI00197DAA79|nr:2Fe-2S iron-sulfur cluster binding domain-containing protein [Paraburkholderia sp. Tr-20389]MBN3754874.1 2Fe-2S iron-sulfur cluster binding domain-containing protein [Paraburkholderia sp. Tr-20389]
MTYHIELTTRDNGHFSFDCAPDQDLLTAAANASLTLPSQCRKGSCGACSATVTHGRYEAKEHNADVLPAGEGAVLMCSTTPRSDLRIALPYDEARVLLHSVPRRSTSIVALETIARNTLRLELQIEPDADGGCAAEFEPGQFMEIEIPGSDDRRPFSLANTSNWDGRLEFLIRLQPGGRFSSYLRERAKPGDTLTVQGPAGAFGIRDDSLRERWFVAGGTGVAPILSMLRRMAEFQEAQPARLFFGVTGEDELFVQDELDSLTAQLPQLKVELCVWKAQPDWTGFHGTPTDALRAALASAGVQPDLYVCGPSALVSETQKIIAEFGIPATQFETERFTSA